MKNRTAAFAAALVASFALSVGAAAQQAPSSRTAPAPPPAAPLPPPYVQPVQDASLAAAGTYRLDQSHSSVTARIRREGLSNFTFRFDTFDASFVYDPERPEAVRVEVTLDPASVDANSAAWREHLQAPDLLDTEKWRDIRFVSTGFRRTGPTRGVLEGNVTFLGLTKPMIIDLTLNGVTPGPRTVIGFSGTSAIRIADFPMPGFAALHLGSDVFFDIEAEFVKR